MMSLYSKTFARLAEEYSDVAHAFDDSALEAILLEVVKRLPEERLPAFETALLAKDPSALEAFLESNVPDLREIVEKIARTLDERYAPVVSIILHEA